MVLKFYYGKNLKYVYLTYIIHSFKGDKVGKNLNYVYLIYIIHSFKGDKVHPLYMCTANNLAREASDEKVES